MVMKKRKYLGLALALGLSSLAINNASIEAGVGGNYYQSIYGNFGDDVTVHTTGTPEEMGQGGAPGIYSNAGMQSVVGDRLIIITEGDRADGVRTNPTGSGSVGSVRIGNDGSITTHGLSADAVNLNGTASFTAGDRLTIETKYTGTPTTTDEGAHGLRTNYGNTIVVGDNLSITTHGGKAMGIYEKGNYGSNVTVGKNSTITTHGVNASAAHITGTDATLEIGDGATWKTNGDDASVIYLFATAGSAQLGSNAKISSEGENSHALAVEGYSRASTKNGSTTTSYTGENAVLRLGDGSEITTSGNNAHGVYMYGIDGLISLGANTEITTSGDGAYGLYGHGSKTGTDPDFTIYGENGKIEVGDGLNLKTTGASSHGAYTDWATSSIEFQGGALVMVSGATDKSTYIAGADSQALYANAGSIIVGFPQALSSMLWAI